jgi:argininosuccinate synthase
MRAGAEEFGMKSGAETAQSVNAGSQSVKHQLAVRYAELVYNGLWYAPLREALDAFVNETQKTVTGNVGLKLYKGNIIPNGISSPFSLYDEDLASFGESSYDHKDAGGFINLFGLPLKVCALARKNLV